MGEVYESVAVHDYSEYTQGCVNVLDEEWARSASSRCVCKEQDVDVDVNWLNERRP